jgi:dienelactone hydrolase
MLAGCTAGRSSAKPSVEVTPATSESVQQVSTRVAGLPDGQPVDITLSSTDANGSDWSSTAQFRAAQDGTVDLARDAPLSGPYQDADAMGLMESLQPTDPAHADPYWWSQHGNRFTITVSSGTGQQLADATFSRQAAAGVRSTRQTVGEDGFDGVYYSGPTDGSGGEPRPAIVAFGGSEGGDSMALVGNALAGSGYPTLTIAYFGAPGLPHDLVNIPLEYFATALRWLGHQPGVDAQRIYLLGTSRGSEAAQLVALHYPDLVHGVILGVPSGVVQSGLTAGAVPAGESAWSFDGEPIPFSREVNQPDPTRDPASVIPDEDIRGPIFLVCGGADQVWASCPFAEAIVGRLEQHHVRYPHVLAEFPQAGHGVGAFVPYEPVNWHTEGSMAGRQPGSNQTALAQVWPKLMDFLHAAA